jgi:hypothetical protein
MVHPPPRSGRNFLSRFVATSRQRGVNLHPSREISSVAVDGPQRALVVFAAKVRFVSTLPKFLGSAKAYFE